MFRAFTSFLLLTSSNGFGISQPTCKISKSDNLDFVCGNIPSSFQPCDADFELANGKATTETTLWLLGEYHTNRNSTNNCLEKLTENLDEHIVYVESTESGKEVACKDKSVNEKKGRKCIGWDNMIKKAELEKLPLSGQEFYPRIIKNIKKSLENIPEKNFDEILFGKRKEFQQKEKNDKTLLDGDLRQIRAMIRVWDFLLKLRNKGYSYKNIFGKKMDEKLYDISQSELDQYKKLQKERNEKMMYTLFQSSTHLFRVVIAGVAHLVDKAPPQDSGASNYVQEELLKGKHQNNYAVLSMKNI